MTQEPSDTQAEIIRLLEDDEERAQTEIAEIVGCADSTVSETKAAYEQETILHPDSNQHNCQFSDDELYLMAHSLVKVSRTKTGEERAEYHRLASKILEELAR